MSKIEKALQKARAAGQQRSERVPTERVLVPERVPAAQNNAALVPVSAPAPVVGTATGSGLTAEQRQESIGSIARMRETVLLERDELVRRGIIYPEIANNKTVNAFREIRTKIIQKSRGRNCVIMVVSPVENGGTTFVTVNLAAAFAFDPGQTALVIDCNFRKAAMHRYFDIEGSRGLTDYLEKNDCEVSDVIHSVGVPRLRVISAGTQRDVAAECFTSNRMKTLLNSVCSRYRDRHVLLDAAPMSAAADTQMLAELCDYIVVVIPYGKLTATQIERAMKGLDSRKVIGVVLNNEPHLPPLVLPSVKEHVAGWSKLALELWGTAIDTMHLAVKHTKAIKKKITKKK